VLLGGIGDVLQEDEPQDHVLGSMEPRRALAVAHSWGSKPNFAEVDFGAFASCWTDLFISFISFPKNQQFSSADGQETASRPGAQAAALAF
jgi:hypothetical protein